jgi:Ca-activated chloride channel family protein
MGLGRIFCVRLALFCLAAALAAQEPSPLSIKVDVRLVNVAFIVRDQSGALAANLTKDDIEVTEDGVPQEIRFFGRSADLPLRLALVVDVSPSQETFNKRHVADIREFLRSAVTPRDHTTLIRFGNHIRAVSDLGQLVEMRRGGDYEELDPDDTRDGGTALFDAICATATRKMASDSGERKAILLFSDGGDNSSAHDLLDAIEAAQSADSPIYTVRYTEDKKHGLNSRDRYGIREMDRLAKETGGASFDASQGDVVKSLAQVAEELRSMYDLGYVSNSASAAGFRKIEIRAKRPGLTIRAKPGYYAR